MVKMSWKTARIFEKLKNFQEAELDAPFEI